MSYDENCPIKSGLAKSGWLQLLFGLRPLKKSSGIRRLWAVANQHDCFTQ